LEVVQRYLHVREEELAPELAMVEKPRVCHASAKYTAAPSWSKMDVSRSFKRPPCFVWNQQSC